MAITSVTKDGGYLVIVEDGVTKRRSIVYEDTVCSLPPTDYTEVGVIYVDETNGVLVVQYNGSTTEIELDATIDLTGAEIVALLEALGIGSRLSHTKLDDIGASDHHAKYLDSEAKAAAVLAGAVTAGETKAPTHDAVVTYVLAQCGLYLPLTGGTLTGDLTIGAHKIRTTDLLLMQENAAQFMMRNAANDTYVGLQVTRLYFREGVAAAADGRSIASFDENAGYLMLKAYDTDSALAEVARLQGAAVSYFQGTRGIVLLPTTEPTTLVEGWLWYDSTADKLKYKDASEVRILAIVADMTTHEGAADPHTGYRLESADHSHQSAGAQAGKLDHGLALDGLLDDDHTQYTKHSLATAASDFLVASGAGVFIKKTLAEVKTILGLGSAAYTAATDYVTHALATVANDFLVASGSGAYIKKTLAETLTILGKAVASGLASLNASTKVVEQPASITDHLDGSPDENDATKAPTSEWAFDHAALASAHGAVSAATASKIVVRDASARAKFAAAAAAGDAIVADANVRAPDSTLLEGSSKATVQDHTPKAHTLAAHSNPIGSVEFNQQQALQLVIENRTSDPASPVEGQTWVRTDLD